MKFPVIGNFASVNLSCYNKLHCQVICTVLWILVHSPSIIYQESFPILVNRWLCFKFSNTYILVIQFPGMPRFLYPRWDNVFVRWVPYQLRTAFLVQWPYIFGKLNKFFLILCWIFNNRYLFLIWGRKRYFHIWGLA